MEQPRYTWRFISLVDSQGLQYIFIIDLQLYYSYEDPKGKAARKNKVSQCCNKQNHNKETKKKFTKKKG